MRIALMLEYEGSHYHGWQSQANLHTVQSVVEHAISKVANEPTTITCAGRTDTGVHALGQVIHFDTEKERSIRAWIHGVNSYLPKQICIKWGREMPDDFHARYSALSRRYNYLIYNAGVRPALMFRNATWHYRPLNHELMNAAAECLLGEHDFSSFRSSECQSHSTFRTVYRLNIHRNDDWVLIDIEANAFLHHMVRNIVGVLMTVGTGRRPISWVKEVLAAKDRKKGAETAPPYGLYLVSVSYPKNFMVMTPTFNIPFIQV